MSEKQSNNLKIAILLIAPVVAALALLALRPDEEVAPPPAPQPVVEKKPEPAQVAAPIVENTADAEAARDALLGLKKEELKPEPEPVKRTHRSRPTRVAREETIEETTEEYASLDTGGLSDAKFRETIEAWRGMRSCVETSKARTIRSSGALRMSLRITGRGDVLDGRVFDESNEAARKVARCVEKRIASLKFPAFETREPAVVKEAKFVF